MTETEVRPYIDPVLKDLVRNVRSFPNWEIYITYRVENDGSGGWTLIIVSDTENSLFPGERIRVAHPFLIPAAKYNRDVWAGWIHDRYADVQNHELGEFLRIDGVRVFAPHHSNGEDPYRVWFVGDYATAAKKQGDD